MQSVAAAFEPYPIVRRRRRAFDAKLPARVTEMQAEPDSKRGQAIDLAGHIRAIAEREDKAAFGALFEHFGPRIKSYFMKTGVPAGRAEELAQETMLNVWRKAAYFDPDRAGAATWIFTIARNLRIDVLRRDRTEQTALQDSFEQALPDSLPDELVTTSERETRVRQALSQLSDEQAAVIRLSFFSDRPHGEIAEHLGIPLGTVKSRIRLAIGRLRDLLGDL